MTEETPVKKVNCQITGTDIPETEAIILKTDDDRDVVVAKMVAVQLALSPQCAGRTLATIAESEEGVSTVVKLHDQVKARNAGKQIGAQQIMAELQKAATDLGLSDQMTSVLEKAQENAKAALEANAPVAEAESTEETATEGNEGVEAGQEAVAATH